MTTSIGEDTLRAVLDAFNRHDLDGIMSHMARIVVTDSYRKRVE